MGATTVQRCMRRCDNWIEHWPDGPIGNTRSCAEIYEEQHTGLRVSHAEIQGCSHTGRWACGVAPWREPYELRGSRTVLREPRGETPWGYSPRGACTPHGHPHPNLHYRKARSLVRTQDQSKENSDRQTAV